MIPAIVISLRRSHDRRASMSGQLQALGIPFTFFDAIDGQAMTPAEVRALGPRPNPRRYGKPLLPGELGCMASFLAVCQQIAQGPHPFVCVLEDDVELYSDIRNFLQESTLISLPRFDVLRLHNPSRRSMEVGTYGLHKILAPYRPGWAANGQVFTKVGAAKVIKAFRRPQVPMDGILYYDGYTRDLRILEVAPDLGRLHPLAEQTTIDPAHIRTNPPKDVSISLRLRRKAFEYRSRFRIWRNFIRQWGLPALLRLRRSQV